MGIVSLAILLACIASLQAQPSLRIVSPADGTVVNPGRSVSVAVEASGTFRMVMLAGMDPIGSSALLSAPPYNFTVEIPPGTTPGKYWLHAMGLLPPGQSPSTFDSLDSHPITLVVERPDAPTELHVDPLALDLNIGERASLHVTGKYHDGSVVDLTNAASTTFVSTAPSIAKVTTEGVVTAVSSGSVTILVNGKVQVPVTVAPVITIVPSRVPLFASQKLRFFPKLAGSNPASVTWSLRPPGVGFVSESGMYTAPATISSQQEVVLTATDTSNSEITAKATVVLIPGEPPEIKSSSCTEARERIEHGNAMAMLVLVPELIFGNNFITDPEFLAAATDAGGVAADGVSTLLLRVRANFPGERIQIAVLNEAQNVSGSSDEDGSLAEVTGMETGSTLPFKAANFGPGQIEVSAVKTHEGAMAFVFYRAPKNFARYAVDFDKASREISFRVTSLDMPCFTFRWPSAK